MVRMENGLTSRFYPFSWFIPCQTPGVLETILSITKHLGKLRAISVSLRRCKGCFKTENMQISSDVMKETEVGVCVCIQRDVHPLLVCLQRRFIA